MAYSPRTMEHAIELTKVVIEAIGTNFRCITDPDAVTNFMEEMAKKVEELAGDTF